MGEPACRRGVGDGGAADGGRTRRPYPAEFSGAGGQGRAWQLVRAHRARPQPDPATTAATSTEAALAREIVEQTLGEQVGPADDLFARGATSLQLMRILLQVKERTGAEVPLARFFAEPTVTTLADLIARPGDAASAALELIDDISGES